MSKLFKTLLTHFSPKANLKEIDPSFAGSGVDRSRNVSEHPISYFYQEGAEPESVVTDAGRNKYVAKLPKDFPLYDIGTDPEGHINHLYEQSKNRQVNAGVLSNDEIHTHLKNKGFRGFFHSTHPTHKGIVGLYHKQPVEIAKSESLIGGKGDKKKDSSFPRKEVKMGHKVEMEHTNNPKVAAEITKDHLSENPKYCEKLKQAGLADELEKGQNGDWQKEGYKFKVQPAGSHSPDNKSLRISAFSPKGEEIGRYSYTRYLDQNPSPSYIQTLPEHQRKGLATAAHSLAEKHFKSKLVPQYQSKEAKALWSQPNRPFGKSLQKALPPEELANQGYKFKILNPTKNDRGHVVRAYHNRKPIGHLVFSTNPVNAPQGHENEPQNGYHHVYNSELHEAHRGKGIYQHMINLGANHAKSLGSKGLVSRGYQRSPDATRAWDKVASHAINQNESYHGTHPSKRADYFSKSENLNKALSFHPELASIADSYAAKKGIELNHDPKPAKVDPIHASKVAKWYESAKHDPSHPDIKSAYNSLIQETGDQYNHLVQNGFKFTPMKAGQPNPYPTSQHMLDDVRKNKHLHYYPTEQGYGSNGGVSDHPMLQHVGEGIHKMPANDQFRIVHDIMGHAIHGNSFGANGEEKAYQTHKQMYSPLAQRALAAETKSQNSAVNFGSNAAHNKANPMNTKYADQKAVVAPDWVVHGEKPNRPFGKSLYKSLLEKGSWQRKMPFNPLDHVKDPKNLNNVDAIFAWQGYGDKPQKHREAITPMEGDARSRALHKLSAATKVRRAKDGGAEFLLHRGDKNPRLLPDMPEGTNHDTHVSHNTRSSWTPHHEVARRFGYDTNTQKSHTDSAWIHEKNIVSSPNQFGNPAAYIGGKEFANKFKQGKNPLNIEHEIIVEPHVSERAPYTHVHVDETQPNLDARITQRGQKGYAHFQDPARLVGNKRRATGKSLNKAQPVDFSQYGFIHEKDKHGIHHVNVHRKNDLGGGDHVGEFQFADDHPYAKGKLFPLLAEVDPKHRRKGLATEAYKMAQEKSGLKIAPSVSQTKEAKALWNQPNRPFGKSELQKGQNGDWQKEGYTIHPFNSFKEGRKFVESNPSSLPSLFPEQVAGNHSAYAMKNGNIIGHVQLAHVDGNLVPIDTKVHDDHKRKGIATSMLTAMEQLTGKKIARSDNESADGKALYSNPNRPFGKSLSEALFETLAKGENHSLCAMFVFENMETPELADVLHCTHKYFGKDFDDKKTSEVIEILENHFEKNPFKQFTPTFEKLEWFGADKDVRVLRPESTKDFLVDLKEKLDEIQADKFPVYKPHVSVSSNVDKVELPIVNYILIKGGDILWKAVKKDLQKSELEKGRPILKFPNLKLKANPDQDIRSVSTPRQKEIAARSQINEMAPKNMHPINRQKSIDKLYDHIGNSRGGFSTMGGSATQGKPQKGMGWVNQGGLTVKRGKGVPYKQLTPEGKNRIDKRTESTKVHEAQHKLFHDLSSKIGEVPTKNLISSYTQMINPEVKNKIYRHLAAKGYGSGNDNEEMLNHVRDILSVPEERESFHHNAGTKDPTEQRNIENHLKQVWQKVYNHAKNFKG